MNPNLPDKIMILLTAVLPPSLIIAIIHLANFENTVLRYVEAVIKIHDFEFGG